MRREFYGRTKASLHGLNTIHVLWVVGIASWLLMQWLLALKFRENSSSYNYNQCTLKIQIYCCGLPFLCITFSVKLMPSTSTPSTCRN